MRWDQMLPKMISRTAAEEGNARAAGVCQAVTREAIIKRSHLVKHVFVTQNYGLLGGWLRAEVYCFPNGDPTGLTSSRIERLQPA
jgi:hypothetical protein